MADNIVEFRLEDSGDNNNRLSRDSSPSSYSSTHSPPRIGYNAQSSGSVSPSLIQTIRSVLEGAPRSSTPTVSGNLGYSPRSSSVIPRSSTFEDAEFTFTPNPSSTTPRVSNGGLPPISPTGVGFPLGSPQNPYNASAVTGGVPGASGGGVPPNRINIPSPASPPGGPGGIGGAVTSAATAALLITATHLAIEGFRELAIVSHKLYEALTDLADTLAPFNQQLAISKALSSVMLLEADIRNANRLGPELAKFTDAQAEFRVALKDAAGLILQPTLPIATEIMKSVADMAKVIEGMGMLVNKLDPETVRAITQILLQQLPFIGPLLQHISFIADIVRLFEEKQDPNLLTEIDQFLDPANFAAGFRQQKNPTNIQFPVIPGRRGI